MPSVAKAVTFRASSIGDCLMGKYLLENIHAQFPQARLGIVVAGRGAMIRDLCAAYPWLLIKAANRRDPKGLVSLWNDFHGSDLVVTQYAGKPGGSFGFGSKIAGRILAKRGGLFGFVDASPVSRLLYDRLIALEPDIAIAEYERLVLKAAHIPITLPFPTLEYCKDQNARAKNNLANQEYIIVSLFAGNKGRGLHPDKKQALLRELAQQCPGIQLVISGSKADQEEAVAVAQETSALVLAGKVTLQELMNLIAESRGVVSVDTGVAHMTAQLKKPLVVMRSCVGRSWWLPGQYPNDAPITLFESDTECLNGHVHKDYPACINAISMEKVAATASNLFA